MNDALKELVACKVRGICARDKLVSEYLAGVFANQLNARRTALEAFRKAKELPECPPVDP